MKKSSVVAVLFSVAAIICSVVMGPNISVLSEQADVAYVNAVIEKDTSH